jgi:flagellar motor switch protein FliN
MATSTEQAEVSPDMAVFAAELTANLEQQSSGLGGIEASESMPLGGALPFDGLTPSGTEAAGCSEVGNIILDIPVTLKVVLGTAKMPVSAVSKLARGAVIKLDNRVGDPVDIYLNGRFLARGQVVVLDEGTSRFGVTLTQIGNVQGSKR